MLRAGIEYDKAKKQCFGIPYSIIIINTFLSNKNRIIYILTFLYTCNKIRANRGYKPQYNNVINTNEVDYGRQTCRICS